MVAPTVSRTYRFDKVVIALTFSVDGVFLDYYLAQVIVTAQKRSAVGLRK